jgi:hypothetical protein
MFGGDAATHISIIIPTLAANAYTGEASLVDALIRIVHGMRGHIENRGGIDWVRNPVNLEENFADKWPDAPQKRANFYKWLETVEQDVEEVLRQEDVESINNTISRLFGERLTKKVFETLAKERKNALLEGKIRIGVGGTMSTTIGVLAKHGHTFFGT